MGNVPPLIMLVDDDVDFLDMNRNVLEAAGYRVLCATDPRKALEHMQSERPAIVVSDLMMESLDAGFGLARQIKENPELSSTYIIIVTAAASQRGFDFTPATSEDLAAMHADAFFSKPVAPRALIAKVQELLGKQSRDTVC